MTTVTVGDRAAGRPKLLRQLLVDSGYVLLGLPLAVAALVVLLVGLVLGVGLVVTVIGLPVLAGTLHAARGLADVERLRLPAVLRQARVRPDYRHPEPGAGAW